MSKFPEKLSDICRSETGQKLEEILKAYSSQRLQIASLHQALEKIEHDQKLTIDSLEYLRKVFSPSDPILQRMNRNRILKSLAFEGMGRRYQDVSMCAPGTFQWILDDLEVPKSHPELKISFRQWLTRGHGVYHISGKPGAGKSTLMKFLVEHKDTQKYLKEWAGTRTLVTPSVFFWRPGTDLQKSMKGLIRSVVHSILKVVPDMIPVVFSQYWNPNEESHGHPSPDFDLPYGKVSEAFERLIGDMDTMKNCCFCFFIDGLDEFEDPDLHHTILVKRLLSWTSSNPANVKLCVSSREENSFINNLSPCQRLRLHLLTMDDMKETVARDLGDYHNFQANTQESRDNFVIAVVSRAEGVFLWLKLVLRMLGDYLEANESLTSLHIRLQQIPEGLEDLFSKMLTSIERSDQDEAWAVLAILMAAEEHRLRFLSIDDYSFLNTFLKNERFAEILPILPLAKAKIMDQQERTILHLNRILKGLAEIDAAHEPDNIDEEKFAKYYGLSKENSSLYSFKGSVKLTHRSIFEFLKTDCPDKMKDYLDNLDVSSTILQLTIAHMKSIEWDSFSMFMMCQRIMYPCLVWLRGPCTERHLEQLATLDDVLMQMQWCNSPTDIPDKRQESWDGYANLMVPLGGVEKRITVSFLAGSFYLGNLNYVAWARKHRALIFVQDRNRAELCLRILNGLRFNRVECGELFELLMNDGFVTRDLLSFQIFDRCPQATLGELAVARVCISMFGLVLSKYPGEKESGAKVLEKLLSLELDTWRLSCNIQGSNQGRLRLEMMHVISAESLDGSEITFYQDNLDSLQPSMSVRDLIQRANTRNCAELLRLIDWNSAIREVQPIPGGWIE